MYFYRNVRKDKRMKSCKRFYLIATIALLMGQFGAALQTKAQIFEVGASAGLSYYMGDINPNKPFSQSRLGGGLVFRYYENTRWAFRVAYSYLPLAGSDAVAKYRPERGLSFKTNVNDFAVIAEFNFLDYFTGSGRTYWSTYIFGGLSVFTFNPKAEDGTELCRVLTDVDYERGLTNGMKKYNKISASIPFGVGVKYSLTKRTGIAFEWRMDMTFTDWLDDCHAYYPTYDDAEDQPFVQYSDPTGLTTDEYGANKIKYIQRGNKNTKDWYGYFNVSLVYKFVVPKKSVCDAGENKSFKYY